MEEKELSILSLPSPSPPTETADQTFLNPFPKFYVWAELRPGRSHSQEKDLRKPLRQMKALELKYTGKMGIQLAFSPM